MALPNLQVPAFPFVPLMPGVPPLPRAPIDIQAPALLAAAASGSVSPILTQMLSGAIPSMLNGVTQPLSQLSSILSPVGAIGDIGIPSPGQGTPQWGIFDDSGNAVLMPDSVVSLDWDGEYRLLDYPIEQGNFESYNKVVVPFLPVVVMRQGGTVSDRQDFINTLESIRGDLNLYTVATPEISYSSCNIMRVSYTRRADQGATVIEARISLKQINVSATSSFSNVQNPTSQDAFNGGTVDTQTPTSNQAGAAAGGPG